MEYKLLKNGEGIILTREPEVIAGDLYITFTGAPAGATAIFEREDKETAYRLLADGVCRISAHFVSSPVRVIVALLDGKADAQRWRCEGIKAKALENGLTVVYPDESDIQGRIAKLQEKNAEIIEALDVLNGKHTELVERFEKLLEGYDIV